jgi:hypothetical protein
MSATATATATATAVSLCDDAAVKQRVIDIVLGMADSALPPSRGLIKLQFDNDSIVQVRSIENTVYCSAFMIVDMRDFYLPMARSDAERQAMSAMAVQKQKGNYTVQRTSSGKLLVNVLN